MFLWVDGIIIIIIRVEQRLDTILDEDYRAMDKEGEMSWQGTDHMGHPVLVR